MESVDMDIFNINPKDLKRCVYKNLTVYARVFKVYDGDTVSIIFKYNGDFIRYSCRLAHIDTPELRTKDIKEKEYALIARDYLADKILEKIIKVKILDFDKYGRLLVELYDPDTNENYSDLLIKGGYAHKYEGKTKEGWVFV
jgi:endonuclease YncB( thermonuclease family)